MKVIGFIGSSRKEGNTAWIVNKILESAKERGAQTQSFNFSDLDIKPCQGCLCCHKGDQGCVIKDDMQKIYDALLSADALILGSPVYMGQMSAQAKIFTDRLFAQIKPKFSPYFKEKNAAKKLILAFSQGNPDAEMFQTYFDYTKHIFQVLEFDVKDIVVVTGMRNGPAYEKEELHAILKNIGASLVLE
ncbi:MAG: flavodoxin family protein [Elusimicrobiota bacterium]|jgi:multimeric flavodoxin WrbA|nr:flavodoxin family protein [Elusimicrobiota bacterium]